MPSVVGLLEQRELGARRRVDELREEADRIQAELAVAELEWQEWVIARRRVDTVLGSGRRRHCRHGDHPGCAGCGRAVGAPGCGAPGAGGDCAGADQQQAGQGISTPATRTRVRYALEVDTQRAVIVLVGGQFRQDGRDPGGWSGRHGTSM